MLGRPILILIISLISLQTGFSVFASPVTVQIDGQTIQIDGSADNPELKKLLESLSEDQRQHVDMRRQEIGQKLANTLKALGHKIRFSESLRFVNTLQYIDSLLLSRSHELASCQSWGICSSAGFYVAIGFKKWATGLGVFYTSEKQYSFNGLQSEHEHSLELNIPTEAAAQLGLPYYFKNGKLHFYKAQVPALLAQLMVRVYVHLDGRPLEISDELEIEYMRISPLKVTGPETVGFGLQTGISAIPYYSAMVKSKARVLRFSCRDLLTR